MSDLVRVTLLIGLVRAENDKLKVYNAGDVVSVTSREAEMMITRRRATLYEPAEVPAASVEPAPVKPAPVVRKKRGS